MGVDKVDAHFTLHGEGMTHHPIEVRLHWGIHSIDETHEMESAVFLALCACYASGDWSGFQSTFYGWMFSVLVTPAAWVKRADFAAGARRALGAA